MIVCCQDLRSTELLCAPLGGALSAVRVQCARSTTIWAYGRTRDPYFEILGPPRGIMVTPSGGFDF